MVFGSVGSHKGRSKRPSYICIFQAVKSPQFPGLLEDGFQPKYSYFFYSFQVIINVTDSNDCPPVFSQKYNFNLPEGPYKNYTLPDRLVADDADGTAGNAELRYSIPGDADGKGFVVHPISGELSVVNTTLDFERHKAHTFKVRATNLGESVMYYFNHEQE